MLEAALALPRRLAGAPDADRKEPPFAGDRSRRRRKADRVSAPAAFGASLGLWMDPDPDRANQQQGCQRQRPDDPLDGRQSRRRIRGAGRARPAHSRPRPGGGARPGHHSALGELPGRDGGHPYFAARSGQSEPQLPRRSGRRADSADCLLHRARTAAALRYRARHPFRRQLAAYLPSTLGRRPDTPEKLERAIELMRIFGAPIGYLVDGGGWGDMTLTAAAARAGVRHMSTELAGGGQVTPAALRIAEGGGRRLLHARGALTREPPRAEHTTRLMLLIGQDYNCYGPEPGLFEPLVELGAEVEAGAAAGAIHPHDTPWRALAVPRFARAR